MSDTRFLEQEEDLMQCWQTTSLDAPDPGKLAREMRKTVTDFDRRLSWRNGMEYVGCALVLAWNAYDVWMGHRLAVISVVAVLFVMGYLWWKHRGVATLDPSLDARSYREALLKRFDQQIRLVSHVKYWYLGPLYVVVLVQAARAWNRSPVAAILAMAITAAAFCFVGWLNEVAGANRLREARADVESMLETEKGV